MLLLRPVSRMAGESSRSLKQTVDFQSASSPLPAPSSAKARRVPKLPSSELEVSESVDGEEEDAEEWEKRAFPVLGPTSDGLFGESRARREGGELTARRQIVPMRRGTS